MAKRIERPGVREGYDRWSESYDATPNPLVSLDRRHTLRALDPHPGESILDAGCGTGFHLRSLCAARTRSVGLDFSRGMLRVAQRAAPGAALAQADLNRDFPIRPGAFDALLSALVSEHLRNLPRFFRDALASLRRGGRFVFSAFHPELARAGIEANFEEDGTEYRLGAERYTVDDSTASPTRGSSDWSGASTLATSASSTRCRGRPSTSVGRSCCSFEPNALPEQ